MLHFPYLLAWLSVHVPLGNVSTHLAPFVASLTNVTNTGPTDQSATDIGSFFTRLSGDLTVFALAMAGFFFALAALFYMAGGATGNERTRSHAVSALYAALVGLALALLAGTIALLVNNAATGAMAGQ